MVLSVAFASVAMAANLTFSNDTNVTLGGYTYIIDSGSVATTVANDGTSLAVEVPTSSTFTLISPNRHTLTTTGGTVTCTNTESTLVITGLTSTTRTITPSTTACGTISGGGGSSYSGGSTTSTVAQSTTPVTVTVSPTVTQTTVSTGCSGGNLYNTSTGQLCNNTVKRTYSLGTTTLKNGSKGEAVKELQRFLNDKLNLGLVVDGKLGPKTIAVIKQWQKNNGLVADGLIGAKTKAKINASVQ